MTQSAAPYDFTAFGDRRAQTSGRRAEDAQLEALRAQLRQQARRIRDADRRHAAIMIGIAAGLFASLALYTFRLTFMA